MSFLTSGWHISKRCGGPVRRRPGCDRRPARLRLAPKEESGRCPEQPAHRTAVHSPSARAPGIAREPGGGRRPSARWVVEPGRAPASRPERGTSGDRARPRSQHLLRLARLDVTAAVAPASLRRAEDPTPGAFDPSGALLLECGTGRGASAGEAGSGGPDTRGPWTPGTSSARGRRHSRPLRGRCRSASPRADPAAARRREGCQGRSIGGLGIRSTRTAGVGRRAASRPTPPSSRRPRHRRRHRPAGPPRGSPRTGGGCRP